METADAVVIGAGVNGASTAFNLLKHGMKKVVLLEKYLIASGGTGKSAALIRQHYSTEELVKMVKRSVEVFHHFKDEIGGECGFVNCGWAFLAPEYVSEGFSRNLAMQQRLGIDTCEITKDELLRMEPRINLSDVHRIAYEPGSGYADPYDTTYSYVQRFSERGGQLRQMTAAQSLTIEKGAVKAVQTNRGEISTGVVVNAAGPWAQYVGKWAGLDVPIKVTREEEVILETSNVGGPPSLAFSDMAKAIYYRPEGKHRTLVGRGFPKDYEIVDPDAFKEAADSQFIEETAGRFVQRFPSFEKALFIRAYTGLYDVTPDWYPILGKTDGVLGFYMCAGFSGHGFKIAPAVGELMAEEIIDGKANSIDISRFNLSRYAKGELFQGAYGANRA
jgi:sarcosine oxidase, subunit beta